MGDETAEQRAQRGAEALERDFGRLVGNHTLPRTFIAGLRRRAAEQLVTWGWTYLAPGEQVTRRPTPRNEDLSLRDELAATIAGTSYSMSDDPVALAEHLVSDGWVKLGPNEKVVTPMSAEEAFETVRKAFEHWETLKKERKGPAEVSSDSSELTSGVKDLTCESLILAVFAGADRPLTYVDACDTAAGKPVRFFPDGPWHRWNAAFRSLEDRGLVEALPHVEGEVKRYQLTQAGRSLHELDGVGG